MFDDIQVMEQVIEGTYKKLKSYYYYDKTLLHIKNKIVDFETGNSFTDRMKKLCKNLYEENQEYFEKLINDIDMVIMPKSLKRVDAETKVIKGNIENNKKISKLNFSIDAPVELFIVDMLWMLIVKKLYLQKYGEFEYSYAGKLKEEILSDASIRKRIFRLDDDKIKWSPRFIHLNELYFCVFYFSIGTEKLIINKDNDKIFERYLRMNGLSQHIPNPIIHEEEKEYENYNITKKDVSVIEYHKSSTTRIGLVNTNIDEKEVIDILLHPDRGMTVEKKQNLYKVLNAAKEEGVNYIIFPEFYMPALWLNDVGKFIKQYGITVITGLQYIVCGRTAYNFVCVIKSTCGKTYFKNIIPFFREKNYYAPEERMDLAALGYTCKNPDKAIYYLIGNGFETFSTILCFEFTDIASRCIMKGKLDFLCVPQLNRDTNYFSSIVEATARDLHTLVVQANTSKYGDSRITGPYKTDFKDILKIKGGENEILIVGKLELKQLQNFRSDYYSKFEKQIDKCLKCKKVHSVHQLLTKCPRCKGKKENIKGLPPNWM